MLLQQACGRQTKVELISQTYVKWACVVEVSFLAHRIKGVIKDESPLKEISLATPQRLVLQV